jgi:hypothetical protein
VAKGKAIQVSGVYDAQDYAQLRAARASLNDIIDKLTKARACGVDCSMYEQMRSDLDNQLAAIQQHFMTPPPN